MRISHSKMGHSIFEKDTVYFCYFTTPYIYINILNKFYLKPSIGSLGFPVQNNKNFRSFS